MRISDWSSDVCSSDLLPFSLRQRADACLSVLFFVLTAALFPFGIGPEPNLLARVAPGIIWVVALLAVLLSLERLFLADFEDGSLEQILLSPLPLELAVLAKVLAHWLTTGLPLIAAAPLLAVLFHMDAAGLGVLLLAMLLGTPTLSLVRSEAHTSELQSLMRTSYAV